MNRLLCDENNDENDSDYNEVEKACNLPLHYDYTYGTIVANSSIPKGGLRFYRYNFEIKRGFLMNEVEMKTFKVKKSGYGVHIADKSFFK
jgi:hypothetical protein